MDDKIRRHDSDLRRVAYIWSKELQEVSDQLPSNIGRSSIVHELLKSLDLLSFPSSEFSNDVKRPPMDPAAKDEISQVDEDSYDPVGHHAADEEESNKDEIAVEPSCRAWVLAPNTERFGTRENLLRYHDAAYVDYLLNSAFHTTEPSDHEDDDSGASGSEDSYTPRKRRKTTHGVEHVCPTNPDGAENKDCPPFAALADYTRLVSAATQTACLELIKSRYDIAIAWDGGRHHALRNKASGFCYVADIVLGIMLLSKEGRPLSHTSQNKADANTKYSSLNGHDLRSSTTDKDGASRGVRPARKPRILYLDLDIHEGDGVHQAFLSPTHFPVNIPSGQRKPKAPNVLTLSIHHYSPTFFPPHKPYSGLPDPDTPHPFTLSIPLHGYAGPRTYERIWTSVGRVKEAFSPDYVVLQLGVDGLPGDRVGQYGAWSTEGPGGLRWCVESVRAWGVPLCVVGGGGYDHPNAARAWGIATSVLLCAPLQPETEVPHHDHFPAYAPCFTLEVPPSKSPI